MEAVEDQSEQFRAFQRLLYSYTNEVEMDSNGRVLVPQIWLQNRENTDEQLIESLKSRTERLHIGFSL